MSDPSIRPASGTAAPPATTVKPSGQSPKPAPAAIPVPAASPKDTVSPPPATGSAAPLVALSADAPATADNGQRFAIGLEYSHMAPNGASASADVIRIHGTHTRTFAGTANGTHGAMVYQAGIGGGGKSDAVAILDIAASAAVRGAVAVTDGGSQVYGQLGPSAHITTVADQRRNNPFTVVGVGGRAEAGVAFAYGEDTERRIQIGVFAESGLTGTEFGAAIRAASF